MQGTAIHSLRDYVGRLNTPSKGLYRVPHSPIPYEEPEEPEGSCRAYPSKAALLKGFGWRLLRHLRA